jgi:hypothetical protein
MAKAIGKPAGYVTDQAIKALRKQFVSFFLTSYFFALGMGFLLGLNKQPYSFIGVAVVVAGLPFIWRQVSQFSDKLERDRINFRKGATGELQIASILERFPDDYRVIHDLKTDYGNIDHVIVGPSGVYVIDTKNWRGVVAADGNGELLLNGHPIKKPEVRNLSRTIMNIKEKVKTLSGAVPYVQGVLAFPSARVDAKWGTTGRIHCLRDEQLYDYIIESKKTKKLCKKEIDSVSQAFLALAVMDKEFGVETMRQQRV